MATLQFLAALVSIAYLAHASGPTPIYINEVPEYSSLSTCVKNQVSTIVRDMYSGCGDGSQTTSYACFCISSSSTFNEIISTAVAAHCNNSAAQASSALDVFAKYCSLGAVEAITTSSTMASSTPIKNSSASFLQTVLPAATATSPVQTAMATATHFSQPHGLSTGAIVGIAVVVPVGVLALTCMGGIIWWKRYRRRRGERIDWHQQPPAELNSAPQARHELDHNYYHEAEVNDARKMTEMPGDLVQEIPRAELSS